MKHLKKKLLGIFLFIIDFVQSSKAKKSVETPNKNLPEFTAVCSFKDGDVKEIQIWAEDASAANWMVFFSLETLFPEKQKQLQSIEIRHSGGTVSYGHASSGASFVLDYEDEEPPGFLN